MKKDILLMWALWNSLWKPYEFNNRPFSLSDFEWHRDDDIAQALCLAETLLQNNWFKYVTFMDKLQSWYLWWYNSLTDYAEWCGRQTRYVMDKALTDVRYYPWNENMSWKHLDWNGSLMRVWPAAMWNHNYWFEQSRVTHNTDLCNYSCDFFTQLLMDVIPGWNKEVAINYAFEYVLNEDMPQALIELVRDWWYKKKINKPSWYVVDTLHAVLYTFIHTTSPMEWFEYIINLWWDTDTTAAIYWYLAWAYYWIDDECQKLIDQIKDVDYIKYLSRKLIERWSE